MMSRRSEIYLLIVLLVVAAALLLRNHISVPSVPGVLASNSKFVPLDVREPNLRLDLLEKIHNTKYTGLQRDIFSGQPLPMPQPKAILPSGERGPGGVPLAPSGPPPVEVPAQFFGYASQAGSNNRVAFFLNGDSVLVVAEGDTFLGNFRLLRIGNDSAEVERISDGRHASVPLEQPPGQAMNP
jgi:hypothetical protein